MKKKKKKYSVLKLILRNKVRANVLTSLFATSLLFLSLTYQNVNAVEYLCATPAKSILYENIFSADGKTHLQADKADIKNKDTSYFTGNVVIQQPDIRIEADAAEYDKSTEQVHAEGNVHYITPDIRIKSETADFNLKTNEALLLKTEYQSINNRARGEASQLEVKNQKILELSNATYTTCNPGNTDWILSASSIKLDKESQQGTASHVVIRFKGVPFFYFPYFRFPLGDKRLSGFLFPSFGRSDLNGTEVKIPYYWNIHPQVDATIIPWYMSKRGTLLHTEFRYLSENNSGTLISEYLNNDKLFKNNRERWAWKHQATPALGWQANAEYNYVADNNHLIDFSNDLFNTSSTHLIQTGNLSYNSQNWLLNIKAEKYQTLSGTEPYQRLPQITFNSRYPANDNAFNYALSTEYVRFGNINNVVIGDRIHIKPSVSWPLRSAAGFLVPKISLQHTTYNLKQTAGETNPSRTIPTFSLNSGLFFERDSQIFSNDFIQTLEPQLFYVYVPYLDQSSLPVFDTSVYAFNVNQSFTDYRFNSIDRIGDDNRLTAALTTRFINQEKGNEVFMARVGQVFYFADRKVQLPSTSTDTSLRSNIIAEMSTHIQNWSLSSQSVWNPNLDQKLSTSSQIAYQYRDKFSLNLAHRFQLNTLETQEVKMNWKLNSRWKLNLAHLYDLRENHIVENSLGLDYESCCWAVRLSSKERFLSTSLTDRGIYIDLILKGLGGFGVRR